MKYMILDLRSQTYRRASGVPVIIVEEMPVTWNWFHSSWDSRYLLGTDFMLTTVTPLPIHFISENEKKTTQLLAGIVSIALVQSVTYFHFYILSKLQTHAQQYKSDHWKPFSIQLHFRLRIKFVANNLTSFWLGLAFIFFRTVIQCAQQCAERKENYILPEKFSKFVTFKVQFWNFYINILKIRFL